MKITLRFKNKEEAQKMLVLLSGIDAEILIEDGNENGEFIEAIQEHTKVMKYHDEILREHTQAMKRQIGVLEEHTKTLKKLPDYLYEFSEVLKKFNNFSSVNFVEEMKKFNMNQRK